MTDARERRRQRADDNKPGFDAMDFLKKFRIPIVILLLWGGGTALALNVDSDASECPGHWHSMVDVYVDGQKVAFAHPSFQQLGDGDAAGFHVHDASGNLHFHPGTPRCIPLDAALEHLAIEKSASTLTIGNEYGSLAGDYPITGDKQFQVFANEWGTEGWEKKSNSFLNKQSGNGDRILIVYGNETSDQIAAYQAGVPAIPANYTPPDADQSAERQKDFVAITAMSLFAILAIVLWYNFAKKTW